MQPDCYITSLVAANILKTDRNMGLTPGLAGHLSPLRWEVNLDEAAACC